MRIVSWTCNGYSGVKNFEILNTYARESCFTTWLLTIENKIENLFQTRSELFEDTSGINFSANRRN